MQICINRHMKRNLMRPGPRFRWLSADACGPKSRAKKQMIDAQSKTVKDAKRSIQGVCSVRGTDVSGMVGA
jgi:hypothetical protein